MKGKMKLIDESGRFKKNNTNMIQSALCLLPLPSNISFQFPFIRCERKRAQMERDMNEASKMKEKIVRWHNGNETFLA